jgi:aldose 1-epimerase
MTVPHHAESLRIPPLIALAAGETRVAVAPALGGSILSAHVDGVAILRDGRDARDPRETGCFPLVPFANRIDKAAFDFDGRRIALAAHPGQPHALHGHGWQRPWTVADLAADRCILEVEVSESDWPSRFVSRQTITALPDGLHVAITVRNIGCAVMPAGLGLHPYFDRNAHTRPIFDAAGAWLPEADAIPRRLHTGDTVRGLLELSDAKLDACFGPWDGIATLAGEAPLRIEAEGARWLHVYAPPHEGYVCLEPVSHAPDALNRVGQPDVARLAPGQSIELTMTVTLG